MGSYYEFFAGGGMARAGLGPNWTCLLANDFSPMKARTYADNWGADHLICGDVAELRAADLPGRADLIWASFPCQDLSLAGRCRGLGESADDMLTRSGTFWPFWSLVRALIAQGRAPKLIVLENVLGMLTSREGRDFAAVGTVLAQAGYRFGAMVIDARLFVPQSRPRVFFVAVDRDTDVPAASANEAPVDPWHSPALVAAWNGLPPAVRAHWVWWSPAVPAARSIRLTDLIEERPTGTRWHSAAETARLLEMMSPRHRAKVVSVQASGVRQVGSVYKRTRIEAGVKHVRAEIRFDDVAGCLRTPSGGSSRQTIMIVDGDGIRSRLLSTREAARLMGLEDSYRLPDRYNDAYHVAGDGVCVPVVRHLASELLEPMLAASRVSRTSLAA